VNVSVVIVGIDQWQEFTEPLIASIKSNEPTAKIVLVDNGSMPPYPNSAVRLNETACYSAAINAGMEHSNADWTIVINNDVLCIGKFTEHLEWMNSSALYGSQLIVHKGLRWLGLWLFAISRYVWDSVGRFDEQFEVCGFDDTDYCIRAQHLGISIEKSDLPFHHYWGKTRWGVPGYPDIRQENKKRLEEKHSINIGTQGDWRVFD